MVELAWCFGFPYADFPGCGPAVAAWGETEADAAAAADALAGFVAAREADFVQETWPAAEAVAEALNVAGLAGSAGGPVVLADTQDNPGGGGHGDTTLLLAELVRQRATGAVVCLINDAASAAACHAAGEGARIDLTLGGASDGLPFACSAMVERLTDGRFTLTGPMGAGNPADLGPSVLIDVDGVRVIVVSRKMQALDQAILRHVGIEPAACPILALKSSVHFRADFGPIARRVLVAIAPGPVVADPAILNFRHVPAVGAAAAARVAAGRAAERACAIVRFRWAADHPVVAQPDRRQQSEPVGRIYKIGPALFSPSPCGRGLGGGVPAARSILPRAPLPQPPPARGGGERAACVPGCRGRPACRPGGRTLRSPGCGSFVLSCAKPDPGGDRMIPKPPRRAARPGEPPCRPRR